MHMQQIFKYTCLATLAAYITVVLYTGMLSLLNHHPNVSSTEQLDFTISYIQTDDTLSLKKRNKKKPLKKPKSSPTPSLPRSTTQVSKNAFKPSQENLSFGYDIKAFEFNQLASTGFQMGGLQTDQTGGVKAGIPPIYPPAALFKNKTGWVEVLITVDAYGRVADVQVLDAQPAKLFDDAAINAVKKWSFFGKTVNGVPTSYQITQTIEFKIDNIIEE